MIELTLPAGSLQAALQAFAGGADAVYLGLQQYSARKNAPNFSFKELAQLKTEAIRLQKKIYVTLNTVLEDSEIDQMIPILRRLELLDIDGIIIQDLGLAFLIRSLFPTLVLHSSTQLAVHTLAGVQELERLGFSRIVLSRELTFSEIKAIREASSQVELKVFIHGALCYGFSGLCMASQIITGRSANRGECAQICRTWFDYDNPNPLKGYCFSMTDLAVKNQLLQLRDIGIDSVKIEGRMKSPAYVRSAAQYYRNLLDGNLVDDDELRTQFSRTPTSGWTFSYGKERPQDNRHTPPLVDTQYPGHKGISIGKVVQGRSAKQIPIIKVALTHEVAVRDGLLLFTDAPNSVTTPIRFGLTVMQDNSGNTLFSGPANSIISLQVPPEAVVGSGAPLYRISQHDLNLPLLNESALKPYRYPITLDFVISSNLITISAKKGPNWMNQGITQSYPIKVQIAKKPQNLHQNFMTIFHSSTTTGVIGQEINITNTTDLADQQLFIALSQLKEIRRNWYEYLEKELEKLLVQDARLENLGDYNLQPLSPRKDISPLYDPPIPWVDTVEVVKLLKAGKNVNQLLAIQGERVYLPLAPIMFEEQKYLEALDQLIVLIKKPVYVGLNNIGQMAWARQHPEIACFIDIYLYMANRYAAAASCSNLESLQGMYHWIERDAIDTSAWPSHATTPPGNFSMPLFISRSCYRYDTLKQSCEGCPRRGNWVIEQNGKKYKVMVRSCVTIVSEQPEKDRGSYSSFFPIRA